jgi:hypothetical protein
MVRTPKAAPKKPLKNVPLTRDQVKKLPVRKTHTETFTDKHGKQRTREAVDVPGFTVTGEFPNNAERRKMGKKVRPSNRKTTPGRRIAHVPVMTEIETKYGKVKAPTGKTRKVFSTNRDIRSQAFKIFDK